MHIKNGATHTVARWAATAALDGPTKSRQCLREEACMDQDRMKGSMKEAKGNIKEAAGKALGDEKMKREGQADQVEGKVQNVVGGIKDSVKDSMKDKHH